MEVGHVNNLTEHRHPMELGHPLGCFEHLWMIGTVAPCIAGHPMHDDNPYAREPYFCSYSPNVVEAEFSEVRIAPVSSLRGHPPAHYYPGLRAERRSTMPAL